MKLWAIGLVLALMVIPLRAEAARKSIFRFEQKSEPAGTEKTPVEESLAPAATPAPPEGSAPPGDAGGRSDWYGEKFPKTVTPGAGEESGLPGTPAEEEKTLPAPRSSGRVRTAPMAPPPELPMAAPSPRPASAPRSIAIPAPPAPMQPQRPAPFAYPPALPGTITPRGYDPSLAPSGDIRFPAPAPVVSGQPPVRPRALPRLAPYGTALPPDQSEPPAAAPR
jgi:hypothetical protein